MCVPNDTSNVLAGQYCETDTCDPLLDATDGLLMRDMHERSTSSMRTLPLWGDQPGDVCTTSEWTQLISDWWRAEEEWIRISIRY